MKRILLSLLSLCVVLLYAQSDSLSTRSIDEVVVEEVRQPIVKYSALGKTYWGLETMKSMPMADPLRNIQLLSGVQTTSENTGGTFVQGCNNSHNYTSLNGTPVYYPMHLLGFFSTFNSLHFRDLVFNKHMSLPTANRLGAEVGMVSPETLPATFGGDVDLGLLTAQATLRLPFGHKVGAVVSGRYSNVNLIYDGLINSVRRNNDIRYRFYDLNATLLYAPTEKDLVTADFFQGSDYADLGIIFYKINTRLTWSNRTASLRWKRSTGRLSMDNRLYYTAYQSRLDVTQTDSRACLPASIYTIGAKSEQCYMAECGFFTYGGELMSHTLYPQSPEVAGSYATVYAPQQRQRAVEGALFFQTDFMLGDAVELIGGLRVSGFHHERMQVAVDPRLTLRYQPSNATTWQLTAGTYTQYLHQVGFSSNGLPSEFWIAASGSIPAQRAAKVSMGLQQDLFGGGFRLSVEPYFSRMAHQVEYKGNALALLMETYDLDANLVVGDGYNYGVDLMLQKNFGKLTGWVAYAWARAPRRFVRHGELVVYPSVHNREHDLNVVANYRLSDKWTLSATYICATGTPYTEVKNAYILGENAILGYDAHNSSRYPTLNRLDVAATYQLPSCNRVEHSVKVAVYNTTFAKNPISYNYNRVKGSHIYKSPVYIFSTAVPSISYFMHF